MLNSSLLKKDYYLGAKFDYTNKSVHEENYTPPSPFNIFDGFKFLLDHFNQDRLFPRTIMTKGLGYQKEVFSKEEAMQIFEQSNFIDCRINAYPSYTRFKEIQRYPPDFISIDLDLTNFQSKYALNLALNKTLKIIKQKMEGFPTVLFTGGGYHIYQPIQSVILENITEFNRFENPSRKFLKFAEQYLTNNRADNSHNSTFKSCLLRVPGSVNSKYNTEVRIIQRWNSRRPHIKLLLGNFLAFLVDVKLKETKLQKFNDYDRSSSNFIRWIEKLLQTPIEDGRKYTLWRILYPYLVNVKKLEYEESFKILNIWLEKCNNLRKLDFSSDIEIKNKLRYVKHYNPVTIKKLKDDNKDLYLLFR